MLLAQRMSLPQGRREDAPQVGMTVELDAKHVEGFAFVPVCHRIDGLDGVDAFAVGQRHLDAHVVVRGQRHEVIEDREVGCGLTVAVSAGSFVDGGQVEHQLEAGRGVVLEMAHDPANVLLRHPDGGDAVDALLGDAFRSEAGREVFRDVRVVATAGPAVLLDDCGHGI